MRWGKEFPKDIYKLADDLSNHYNLLEDIRDEKEEQLSGAQDAERPSERKIEALEEQLGVLEDAITDLDNCISTLRDYL
jgi:chromosome segregation ATPase